MVPIGLAWGDGEMVKLPDQRIVWRMAFELLPGATMTNAQCTLHGMVAAEAFFDDNPLNAEPRYLVNPGTLLEVYAINLTTAKELQPYVNEIISQFRRHLMGEDRQRIH
jgi:hypothetical protein